MLVCRTDYDTEHLPGPGGRPAPNQGVCALSASGSNIPELIAPVGDDTFAKVSDISYYGLEVFYIW
jgi:hypothetical protein